MEAAVSSNSAVVELQNITKRFTPELAAINGVSLSINKGEILSLLGPSGCGKTTTLRVIAGLEDIDEGRVLINGRVVTSPKERIFKAPDKRGVGLVFQSYALWPHMKVYNQIAYGLRPEKLPASTVHERVMKVIDLLGLQGLEDRYPAQLSGGQQQRVALGRALVYEPDVLLLDEPLSNIDVRERERMRAELRRLLKTLGKTALYVTHDQEEAFVISDRVMIMRLGEVIQQGVPREIYERPRDSFIATFIGRANIFKGVFTSGENGRSVVRVDGLSADLECRNSDLPNGSCMVVIRPSEMALFPSKPSDKSVNLLMGNIIAQDYRGGMSDHHIAVGNSEILVTSHRFCPYANLSDERRVHIYIPPEAITVIPTSS